MAVKTTTTFTNLLKRNYHGEVMMDLLEKDNKAVQFIFRNKIFDGGSDIRAPVRTRRASGSTWYQSETGSSPTAANPTQTIAYDTMKFLYTNKEISQHLINATKNKTYAYLRGVDDMATDAASEHADQMERHLFTTTSGCLCAMSGAGTSATVLNVATDFNFDILYVGMAVDVFRITEGDVNSVGVDGDTIASWDASAYTVTLTTGVADYTSLDTTYGLFAANTRSGTTNYAPNSLNDICGTGNLHNVDVSSSTEYVGNVDTLGAALTLKACQQQIDDTEKHNGGEIGLILGHDSILRDYQFDIIDPRVIQAAGEGLAGTGAIYFKGRSKKRIQLVGSCYANPNDRLWFLDKNSIKTYYTAFSDWCVDDHGELLHKKSGSPVYEALLGSEYNLIAWARYRNGYIDNIT